MIPVIQTKVCIKNSEGKIIQNGNCYPAAIASILELPITEVPNFEVFYEHYYKGKYTQGDWIWEEIILRFLIRHGVTKDYDNRFRVFHVSEEDWNTTTDEWDRQYKDLGDYEELISKLQSEYYFISGTSARGLQHITIWQGDKMVHDPHPTGEGILDKRQYEYIRPLTTEERDLADNWDNMEMVRFPSIKNNLK
jgi:hypothetical protein